jgi:hypothetical protein
MICRKLSVALLFAAAPAFAGNLAVNTTFDHDLSGWEYVEPQHAQWQSADALGRPTSGSLRGTNDSTGSNNYYTLLAAPCAAITPGTFYEGGLDYRIPAGQDRILFVFLEVVWYNAGGCADANYIGNYSLVEGSLQDGVWHRAESNVGIEAPVGAAFASFRVDFGKIGADSVGIAEIDNVVFKPRGTCGTTPDRLCLNHDRFQVTSTFENYAGVTGSGFGQSMTDQTGYFWFFNPANVELVIKVINGCNLNSNYWIYAGGLTDVEVALVVKDMSTGTTVPYANHLGTPFQPIGDIGSFPVCP